MGTTMGPNAKWAVVYAVTLITFATLWFNSNPAASSSRGTPLAASVGLADTANKVTEVLHEVRYLKNAQQVAAQGEAHGSMTSNRQELQLLREEISALRGQVATNDRDITELKLSMASVDTHQRVQGVGSGRHTHTGTPVDLASQSTAVSPNQVLPKAPETCKLPAMAPVRSIDFVKDAACLWESADPGNKGKCVYKLKGDCKQAHHDPSGCTFYGIRVGGVVNEQYGPSDFVLPDPPKGQIDLTVEEEAMLRKPFEPCDSRPRFFMVSQPLLNDGKVIAQMGTVEKPLVLMGGGSPGIAQHFYFVLNEVGLGDTYRLGTQDESEIKLVVDIGANIGLFSISACLRFPKARILAFEPHPANFRFLKHNLAAAGCEHRVEAHNRGISNDGRSMKIYWHDSIGTSAFRKSPDYTRMDTISPESLFKLVGPDTVSLLKIDCEGCEYEVVPLLPLSQIRQMFCEVHSGTVTMDTKEGNAKAYQDKVHETCKAKNPLKLVVFG